MPSLELALASFVLRHTLPDNTTELLSALLSDFLIADLSVARACEVSRIGSLDLVKFIWSRRRRASKSTLGHLLKTNRHYYRWEFSQALVQAVRRADLVMIQWILAHFVRCPVAGEVVREAAKGGHLWVLQLLEADRSHGGIKWSAKSLTDAAEAGHWELTKWLDTRASTQEIRSSNYDLLRIAITQNKLESVKWVVANHFAVTDYGTVDCPENEWGTRVKIVRYLLTDPESTFSVFSALLTAARVGDLDTMQWLLIREEEFHDAIDEDELFDCILYTACEHGHLRMVQWLLDHIDCLGQSDGPSEAMRAAATHGKLPIVQWLWDNYLRDPTVALFKNSSAAMDAAAERGHLEVLKFLDQIDKESQHHRVEGSAKRPCVRGRYPQCTVFAMDSAAANGFLDVVKWLHLNRSEGCTTAAMDNAAANGHLKVVQWLHWNRSEGATTAAMDKTAARRFHGLSCRTTYSSSCCMGEPPSSFYKEQLATLRWLDSNRSEGCTTAAMDEAAANGNFQVLQCLHDCVPASCSSKAMDAAAGLGRLDIVKWLHTEYRALCTPAAMDNAAAGGHLNVVRWLHANRTEGCTANAMNLAAAYGHVSMVRWLLEHRAETNIISAIEHAIVCKQFEMMWYLDAQRTDHSVTLRQMQNRLRNRTLHDLARPRT